MRGVRHFIAQLREGGWGGPREAEFVSHTFCKNQLGEVHSYPLANLQIILVFLWTQTISQEFLWKFTQFEVLSVEILALLWHTKENQFYVKESQNKLWSFLYFASNGLIKSKQRMQFLRNGLLVYLLGFCSRLSCSIIFTIGNRFPESITIWRSTP